jgi:ABC-type polysaccharide/polyol phosphate export permease
MPVSGSLSAPPASGLSGPLGLRFGEVWAYRELLYFLVWRDVKIRCKQTAMGVLWVALQPVLTIPFVIQFWMVPLPSPILLRSFPRAFAGFMD